MILEDLKGIVAATASISTILQFLTGTVICLKITKNKSTGDLSAFPFVSGCLSTSLWLRYGFLITDSNLILVNTIGATLFFSYVLTFLVYSIKKLVVVRQLMVCLFFIIATLIYIHNFENPKEARNALGIICCVVTVIFFAAPLASFIHVVRVKNTESLPFPIIIANFIVAIQWLLYGIMLNDRFIQVPNLTGCLLSGFQLSLFCVYPKGHKVYSNEFV